MGDNAQTLPSPLPDKTPFQTPSPCLFASPCEPSQRLDLAGLQVTMASLPEVFDSDLLYNLATACEELFDTPALASSVRTHQIEEQWTECQQRFSIWASQLGVFARKNQSLDARLRKVPDVQDLVARLLEILRRSLSQCKSKYLPPILFAREDKAKPSC